MASPNDVPMKPTNTTSRVTTRQQIVEEAPETEDDILESMVILIKPAKAKKAAI